MVSRYARAPHPGLLPHQQTMTTTNPGLSFWPDEKRGSRQWMSDMLKLIQERRRSADPLTWQEFQEVIAIGL